MPKSKEGPNHFDGKEQVEVDKARNELKTKKDALEKLKNTVAQLQKFNQALRKQVKELGGTPVIIKDSTVVTTPKCDANNSKVAEEGSD